MTTFYICRHGETENNLAMRLQGWVDTPLTQTGKEHAQASAQKLIGKNIDLIVCSDLGRAFGSAYIISRELSYEKEIEALAGFREVNYGDYANLPYDKAPKINPESYSNFVYPGGESLEQMKTRVIKALASTSRAHPGATILIVAHDGTINAIKAERENIDMAVADQTHNPNGAVFRFTYDNGSISDLIEVS